MRTKVSTRPPLFGRPPVPTAPPAPAAPAKRSRNASRRWASSVLGSLDPAAFQRSLAAASRAGADAGPGHLVTEELAADPALGALAPAHVAPGMDPCTAGPFALFALRRGPQHRGGVTQLLVRRPRTGEPQEGARTPRAAASAAPSTLSSEEESPPPWRASVRASSAPAAVAAARRPLATDAEEPATAASHCAAVPCPALACAPVSSTRGA